MRLLFLLLFSATVCWVAAPAYAQNHRVRPSWGEAWLASVGTGVGMLVGGAAGAYLEQTVTPPDCGCLTGLSGGFLGGTVGAGAGALTVRAALGQRRGSVLGAMVGTAVGVFTGAMLPVDPNGQANALLMPVLGALGGAAGYRYGPWAQGPVRRPSMTVTPVPLLRNAGVYAAVRF